MKRTRFVIAAALVFTALAALAAAEPITRGPASPPREAVTLRHLLATPPPSSLDRARTALVLVDFQDEFFHGRLPLDGASAALRHAVDLAGWARRSGMLIVNVRNVAARPGSPLFDRASPFSAVVADVAPQPGDLTIVKAMGGAFSHTNLDGELRSRGIDTLVVAGLMTHLAVHTTASDGYVLGYHVLVAGDATATRALPGVAGEPAVDAQTLQRSSLDAMADRVADVLTTEALLHLPVKR